MKQKTPAFLEGNWGSFNRQLGPTNLAGAIVQVAFYRCIEKLSGCDQNGGEVLLKLLADPSAFSKIEPVIPRTRILIIIKKVSSKN